MATPTDSALRSRVDAFVADLSVLVRASALQAVQEALGGAAPAKRGPGRPRGTTKASPAAKSGRRAKRDPEAVMAMAARIHSALKEKSGQSATELAGALRIPLAALKLPMAKLLSSRVVTTQGQRRGMRYYAGGAAQKAAARPAAKVKARPARKPAKKAMSPEARAVLLERLAKARAARAAK